MQFVELNSINIRSQISLEKEKQKNSHYKLIIASYFYSAREWLTRLEFGQDMMDLFVY